MGFKSISQRQGPEAAGYTCPGGLEGYNWEGA